MQMFVGLMCWFAAKVTRSPCFARLTASAMWPIPSRSLLSKSATPSLAVSRSPRSTLAATGRSAGSLISAASSETAGDGTALLLEALDGEGHVVTPKAKAVAQHGAHRPVGGDVRRVVQVEFGIRRLIVDRRRDHAVAHGQCADDELHGAGCAEHVARHRLRGTHVHLRRRIAEHRLDRFRLVE